MRVKRGVKARRRRNRILKLASGFRGRSGNTIRQARARVDKSLTYRYRDRKVRKREFRQLWIARISAASELCGMSYSKFIGGLKKAGIEVDRKMLADLGAHDMKAFQSIVDMSRTALNSAASNSTGVAKAGASQAAA